MRLRIIACVSMTVAVLTYGSISSAQVATQGMPQASVECSGWHALCSLATDCKIDPYQAGCDCWKVTEQHIVVTSHIKDETFGGAPIKELTQSKCTKLHPCGLDQAPVCQAIKNLLPNGQWVSTFSYRGWCEHWDPVKCEGPDAGPWADCMTSLCTKIQDPKDPNRPLSCQCQVNTGNFVGTEGSCQTQQGTVMSTIPLASWDFRNGTFSFSVPGDEYVKESCLPVSSDREPANRYPSVSERQNPSTGPRPF
jgi:hypothetical protein